MLSPAVVLSATRPSVAGAKITLDWGVITTFRTLKVNTAFHYLSMYLFLK